MRLVAGGQCSVAEGRRERLPAAQAVMCCVVLRAYITSLSRATMFTRHAHARSSYPCSLANLLKLHFPSNYTALAVSVVGAVTRHSPAALPSLTPSCLPSIASSHSLSPTHHRERTCNNQYILKPLCQKMHVRSIRKFNVDKGCKERLTCMTVFERNTVRFKL